MVNMWDVEWSIYGMWIHFMALSISRINTLCTRTQTNTHTNITTKLCTQTNTDLNITTKHTRTQN